MWINVNNTLTRQALLLGLAIVALVNDASCCFNTRLVTPETKSPAVTKKPKSLPNDNNNLNFPQLFVTQHNFTKPTGRRKVFIRTTITVTTSTAAPTTTTKATTLPPSTTSTTALTTITTTSTSTSALTTTISPSTTTMNGTTKSNDELEYELKHGNILKGAFLIMPSTDPEASDVIKQDAINFATLGYSFFEGDPNQDQVIANYIKEHFDAAHGPNGWSVVVSSDSHSNFSSAVSHQLGDFVALKRRSPKSLAFIEIFRPFCKPWNEPDDAGQSDISLGDLKVLNNTNVNMPLETKQDAVNFVLLAFYFQSSQQQIADYVKHRLEGKHRGSWIVVVNAGKFSASFDVANNNLIYLRKSSYNIVVTLPQCAQLNGIKMKSLPNITIARPVEKQKISISVHQASTTTRLMREFALKQAQISIDKFNTSYDRCKFIKSKFEERFSGSWFCGSGKQWSSRCRYHDNTMIVLSATGPKYTTYIQLYQLTCSRPESIKHIRSTATSLNLGSFHIMPDSDQALTVGNRQDLINLAGNAIAVDSRFSSVSQYIKDRIEGKYGGFWTVAAGDISAVAFNYNTPFYIRLRQGESSKSIMAFMHPKC